MKLGRVIGRVVCTQKVESLEGLKLLLVQPLDENRREAGAALVAFESLLAVDGVQAGIGDLVLVVDEGGSARSVIGDESAMTIRTAICGIVDRVDIEDRA